MLLEPFFFEDRDEAIGALTALGADYDERLDMVADHPEIGKVERYFAIVGNVRTAQATNPVLSSRLIRLLDDPDNERLRVKMDAGWLSYTPSNKRLLRKVAALLHETGVHLPWAYNAMNIDLSDRMLQVAGDPIPFDVFYGRFTNFRWGHSGGEVELGRLFSTVIDAGAQSTWLEPIHDNFLDEDVGIVLEANAR
jgi:hypothetical protein